MARSNNNQISVLAVFLGLTFVYNGVRRVLKHRRMVDTASSSIAHAPQGGVEIQAFAWPIAEPIAKNSFGDYCVYYHCELQRYQRAGKHSRWVKCWEYRPQLEFLVIDLTGVAQVNADGADISCETKTTNWKKVSSNSEIHQRVTSGYEKISTGWLSTKHRIIERFILLGSPCYLQGVFHTGNEKLVSTSQGAWNFQTYLKKRNPGAVHENLKFDADKDGKVTATEVRKFMYKTAKNITEGFHLDDNEEVSLKICGHMKTTKDQKLIIADMHEQHFLGRIGAWNLLKIIGGAALASIGVVSLFW